ncbi:MAG: hypothetical protein D3905_14670 [Candidatus Electrothrix sp. AS4_5]|nr:hypothetical protein [Candidatus Electrothrix gigas]
MGGEPLLHPTPESFITATRAAFSKSHIKFVTNGILLPQASAAFFKACREANTVIDLTVYPPLEKHVGEIRALCKTERVDLSVIYAKKFIISHNLKGDSNKEKAFKICHKKFNCPILEDGRIYPCRVPAYVHLFNKKFNFNIATGGGYNIHSDEISGAAILAQLNNSIDACRWCSYEYPVVDWSVSKKMPADWDAAEYI